jgi:hypothetical protein
MVGTLQGDLYELDVGVRARANNDNITIITQPHYYTRYAHRLRDRYGYHCYQQRRRRHKYSNYENADVRTFVISGCNII